MTTIVTLSAPYNGGLTGQIMGFADDDAATAFVEGGGGTLANLGAGAGVPVYPAGGWQGQIASELTSQFLSRIPGGVPNPSSAIQGVQGQVQIVCGRNVPVNDTSWA